MHSLKCYFGVYFPRCCTTQGINTTITLSWMHKQFATWVHTLFYINIDLPLHSIHSAACKKNFFSWTFSAIYGFKNIGSKAQTFKNCLEYITKWIHLIQLSRLELSYNIQYIVITVTDFTTAVILHFHSHCISKCLTYRDCKSGRNILWHCTSSL